MAAATAAAGAIGGGGMKVEEEEEEEEEAAAALLRANSALEMVGTSAALDEWLTPLAASFDPASPPRSMASCSASMLRLGCCCC